MAGGIPDQCWVAGLIACSTSPKAGFSSFRCSKLERITKAQARDRGLTIRLYVRNPIERLRSAWAMYAATNNHVDCPGAWPGIRAFIDQILGGWCDPHWLPQMQLHEEFDEIYRLENIAETWPGDHIGHENRATIAKPHIDYRFDDLTKYYAADIAAHREAI